jgi:hypothetical protein
MSGRLTESDVEDAALHWLEGLGYTLLHGPDIAPGQSAAERADPGYRDVILERRLREALVRLNPELPAEAAGDAYRQLVRADAPSLIERNRAMHRMLVNGVTLQYRRKDDSIAGAQARVLDFDDPDNNDWLAVNQLTIAEGRHARRPDVVLFINGLPLAVIELKNAADENATIWSAFDQLQTYQAQIPALFAANAALIVSDGVEARWAPARSGSSPGAPSLARALPRTWPSCRWGWRACSRSAASSTSCATSSCSRTLAEGSSSRRWRATTSSTRSTWRWRRRCVPPFPSPADPARPRKAATTSPARSPAAAPKATAAWAWCGTPRARAKA